MQNIDYNSLKEFLNESDEIPVVNEHIGFLDVIRKTTNETINSNIYAHFLSCNDDEIKYAFLNALLAIITEKTQLKTELIDIQIFTEYSTNTGRIDIVIRDLINENHIIIENKIKHKLNNDLQEYWDFIKVTDAKKRGILLTLSPHYIPKEVDDKFINITHWEWISKVKELIDISEIKKENYKVYLSDFFETIEKITYTYHMNDSAKFYFENAKQINAASKTKQEGHKFLNDQYYLIAEKLGMQTFGNELGWKNIWDDKNKLDTYFTIIAGNIVEGRELSYSIIIELYREDKARIEELNTKFKTHPQFITLNKGGIHHKFHHYLIKEYKITFKEFENFADNVVSNIKNDFGKIFIDIVNYLHPTIDKSEWENNLIEEEVKV